MHLSPVHYCQLVDGMSKATTVLEERDTHVGNEWDLEWANE